MHTKVLIYVLKKYTNFELKIRVKLNLHGKSIAEVYKNLIGYRSENNFIKLSK